MKRDWDLIRYILLEIESKTPQNVLSASDFTGDITTISYHLTLLLESGLVIGHNIGTLQNSYDCKVDRLSWAGHDFLDAISNETIWSKVKNSVKEAGGKVTIETPKAIAIKYMSTLIT